MAKTILFNDKNYSIDEAALAAASSSLQSHLSTVMNGTGAVINFGGVAYSIDSAKLSAAENNFAAYLDTIGTDAPADDQLEGSGAEFYTLAPAALSFRSTAPLGEFQEVQVNGQTVDPSNYTLEEGSTIVKLSIDYLKTLDVGNYDIAVKSNNKTAIGDFTVKAPELNEHSFYYNQPYTAYVEVFGGNTAVFIRNDGTLDLIVTDTGYAETCNYTIADNQLTIQGNMGAFTASPVDNGNSMFVNELYTTFVLGDESIAADEDYIYIYKEDLGGYEVTAIDKTKAEYGPIKTGINWYPTVKLADLMFQDNMNLIAAPTIPVSVTRMGASVFALCSNLTSAILPDGLTNISHLAFSYCDNLRSVVIGNGITTIDNYAFYVCPSLESITFKGTVEQWNAISKDTDWNLNVPATHVTCLDGQVAL